MSWPTNFQSKPSAHITPRDSLTVTTITNGDKSISFDDSELADVDTITFSGGTVIDGNASANNLAFTNATITGITSLTVGSLLNSTATQIYPVFLNAARETVTTSTDLSVTTNLSLIDTNGGALADITLPNATIVGLVKRVILSEDGGNATVTITTCADGASSDVFVLSEIGQGFEAIWVGAAGWRITHIYPGFTDSLTLPTIS